MNNIFVVSIEISICLISIVLGIRKVLICREIYKYYNKI